ncbi:dephospho-CoA kinase [Alkalicoccus luteus]|uniref:Dephospho-CoA kinase n=1 Tax=Alkalicoccus luteus TaxID=1237094 RepID=A0A969PS92_9BACI|nr:dephospho-CoA kinase [Alkalicoccus luteus]NJP37023.1 dephospho-CoA kinase [Alkalicoccus luteus]
MKLGLTGSIATGKSTAAGFFREEGCPVIDADIIAREVVQPGTPALNEIKAAFGSSVIAADGTLDREKLGSVVFSDPAKREQLNAIVHPVIRRAMKQQADEAEAEHEIVVLDIPLLFENELFYLVDKTAVVYVPEKTQLERLMKRNGYSEQEARSRMESQLSIEEKKKRADFVIANCGSEQETARQVSELIEMLLQKQ